MTTATRLNFPIRGDKLSMSVEVRSQIARLQTPFQTIEIVDTPVLGTLLLLDGHIQLSTLDEHAYHESLVQIPMATLPEARRALVVGGGDGGALRELCRHSGLETIDLVEIDRGVIDLCRRHMPELSAGAFDDPRVAVHCEDAFGFMKLPRELYDLIVLDVTDVYEGEDGALSERLFTGEFHDACARALAPGGLLVTQADNLVFCPYSLEAILDILRGVFPKTGAYQALVPSFGGYSGFAWAGHRRQLSSQCPGSLDGLRYLTPTTWALAFEPLPFMARG
ncbi:MAG: spermidine synthase [Fimbriimonas ginsengisoli]|uniref:Polyamine aminopropyltransferase n=1 Tax=Fimbriimonas ginsengisoli TaxID=1005039 RepID=A0A931PWX8_FIMGI|nr:spermidine synthase [Fimbriimonas ginsengisoli]MBI3721123.1 spermidine synthase [Fimbriimonas ginsengisoli]